jgi:hypothetical protein
VPLSVSPERVIFDPAGKCPVNESSTLKVFLADTKGVSCAIVLTPNVTEDNPGGHPQIH